MGHLIVPRRRHVEILNFLAVSEVCFYLLTRRVVQTKMPNFRETRACTAYAYGSNLINEQEFVPLYDCHRSANPDFPYWNYERFDLDEKSNDECKAEFRFHREAIYKLAEQLQLPDEITTYNGLVVASVPALCMYLKRFAYPCRWGDLVYHFARPVPEISIIHKPHNGLDLRSVASSAYKTLKSNKTLKKNSFAACNLKRFSMTEAILTALQIKTFSKT